jgi:Mrp family chromosome partitioning ATPase
MTRGSEGEEVVRAIIAMGRAMGKSIVAEGVETELQSRKLLELGCDGGQGYLFARPLTPWDVEALLLRTDVGALSILPAGRNNGGATELPASARMAAIAARLLARNPNRIVLFDSPPLLVSSESRALSSVMGQVVLVVRNGATPRDAVLETIDTLGEGKDISLVLNQGRIRNGGGYYYGFDYGSEQSGKSDARSD